MNIRFVQLSDVCDLQNGFAFKSTDYVEKSNTCNIRMSNIRPGGSFNEFHNERYLPDSYAKEYKDYLLNDGDLIIAMTDMATETKILGLPTLVNNTSGRNFLLNQRVGKLCKFSKDIYVPYLRHILTAQDVIDYYKSKGAGGLQINISKKDILSVKFPLPPLATQQKIVAKLDAIFAEIDTATAAAEANVKNAEALFQSYLNEVFSSNENLTKLKDCTRIKPPKSEIKNLKGNTSVSFMPMESLGINDKFTISKQSKDLESVSGSYTYFTEGDVLLAKITPCFENGKLGIASNLVNGIGFGSSEYIVFRPNKIIDKEWLYYFLNRESFRVLGSQHMSGSVGHKRVTKEFIEETLIPLIPVAKQKEFVGKIDNVFLQSQILKSASKSKIRELTLLKQSILQKAFSGELVKD